MKKLLFLFVLLPLLSAQAKDKAGVMYDATITRVKDGDTVAIVASFLPDPLPKELAVRVYGVDTPEKGHRAQCPQVLLMGWDKFGGRVLGDIILDGKSLRASLIANGFAREYYGEEKQSWCK